MVDDLGLSFESMASVRSALSKFVTRQMQPGDLVAICRTAAGSGTLRQFTNDKRILLSIIDGLRWDPNGRAGVNFFEQAGKYSNQAQAQGAGEPSSQAGGATAAANATDPVDPAYRAQRNAVLAVGTLGAVNFIIRALREMPGRKSIVLFSDGLQLFTPGQAPSVHTGPGSLDNLGSDYGVADSMHKLIDSANRSGTVIYTMHAAGLQTMQPDAGDRIVPTGVSGDQVQEALSQFTGIGMAGLDRFGGRDVAFNSGQQGLANLALDTGGIPYQNGNDMNWGLDRVLRDQEGYYLIGFKPPSNTFAEKHGARPYHHVSVKVTRPGLHARSRTGFFGETDAETMPKYQSPLEQMRAAMVSPFRSSDVRLRLTALYAEAKNGAVVRNLLHIDARDLTFHPDSDTAPGSAAPPQTSEIEIIAMATSMGVVRSAVAQLYKVHAPLGNLDKARTDGVVYQLDVPLKKRGAYQIQVAVRDMASGKIGSASQFLEIPELKHGRMALTSILLQSGNTPAGAVSWSGMSPATRQFQPGSQLEYLCLLENSGKSAPANVDSRIRIIRDNKEIYSGPARLVPMEGGHLAVTGILKLSDKMPPGDYYLGITADDRSGGKNHLAAQWTDFEILH